MTRVEFEKLVNRCFKIFRDTVPNKNTRYVKYYLNHYGHWQKGSTGNMAFNALQSRYIKRDNGFWAEIYIEDNIAPYVVYTNERWVSSKWKGHKNPNEGWVQKGANRVALYITKTLNGDKGTWKRDKGKKYV